ncbi:MAG: AMP-binding protein [Actinomycetota bacterium]
MTWPGLGSWIERRAFRAPGDAALRTVGGELSYEGFAGVARSVAARLLAEGVSAGDRVAYHGDNRPLALASLFASRSIGAVWVPILATRRESEVVSILRDSSPRALIRAEPGSHPETDVLELSGEELTDAPPPPPLPAAEVKPDDLAILAYTSGSTGDPKGVMLTESNLLWNVVQMAAECALSSADVTIASAPFTRMGGLGVTVLPTLFVGGTVSIPDALDGTSVLRTIERDRVTVMFGNPDLLERALHAPEWSTTDLGTIRTAIVGGGLVPQALLRAYLDRGVTLRHGYGLTEASPVVSLLRDDEAAERPTSVGKPLPFVDVRAVRPDGSECDVGESGEWLIRGPNVCAGYRNRPPAFDGDGWFHTGDVGSIDADGYLTFVDRASSGIRVGGTTVYPATVELRLYGLPCIADAAVGEVDGRLVAAVVAEPDCEPQPPDILAALRESLPAVAVPAAVQAVGSIPRNAAGKVRRDELRALLAREPSGLRP